MRISEIREREDFDSILSATLSQAWTLQLGHHVSVSAADADRGETWYVQPLLSFLYTRDLCATGRRFVADSFRNTNRISRAPAQWLLGTALSSEIGMRVFGQAAIEVSEVIPDSSHLLILPGNLRIRVFDFKRQVCRVVAKKGFSTRSIAREVKLREEPPSQSMLKISASGETWFEEPLVHGYCLPRLPLLAGRRKKEELAIRSLGTFLQSSFQQLPIACYLDECSNAIASDSKWLRDNRGLDLVSECADWATGLAATARSLKEFKTAQTHGDFQPGNIIINRAGKPLLIDWEFSERRSWFYDCFVYDLNARQRAGLAERSQEFLNGRVGIATRLLVPSSRDVAWRQCAIALFLLEEIRWVLAENQLGPYCQALSGILVLRSELEKLSFLWR